MSVFTQDIEDILTLLALTVFADKRLFAQEIEAFMGLAADMEDFNHGEKPLSQPRMLVWFENNKAELMLRLDVPGFEDWFYALLDRLAHLHGKPAILKAMAKLAASDDDVHVSERALLKLTAERWGIAA